MDFPASYVYCPPSQRVGTPEARALLAEVGAALWISGADLPSATLLPTTWTGNRLLAHASAENHQFSEQSEPVPCRVIIQGADSYISPRWYPSAQSPDHGGVARGRSAGRAVGTWDYQQVQIAGWLRVIRDREWLRAQAKEIAERMDEERLADAPASDAARGPWRYSEAPEDYLEPMLGGIVGLELEIIDVVGRFKLSQNRTAVDRTAVASGLRERGRGRDLDVAAAVESAEPLYPDK